MGGAAVLRRRGITARAVQCAVLVQYPNSSQMVTIGLNPRQVHSQFIREEIPFEKWAAERAGDGNPDELLIHAIIEANLPEYRAIIDLTFGQLQRMFDVQVPSQLFLLAPRDGWPPEFTKDELKITYMDSPQANMIPEDESSYAGFIEDLDQMLDLALGCNLDEKSFITELKNRLPREQYDLCRGRIIGWTTPISTGQREQRWTENRKPRRR